MQEPLPPPLTPQPLPLQATSLMEPLPVKVLLDLIDLDHAVQQLEAPRHVHVAGLVHRPSRRWSQAHLRRRAGLHVVALQEGINVPSDQAGQVGGVLEEALGRAGRWVCWRGGFTACPGGLGWWGSGGCGSPRSSGGGLGEGALAVG